MTAAALIGLAIKISISLLVFSLGLEGERRDLTYLFRNPGLLLRSLLAMNGVMLALVLVAVTLFDLPEVVNIVLIVLAVSPVPPVLPKKQEKAGGPESYAVGLLVAAALVSIVLIPLAIGLVGYLFDRNVHVSPGKVAPVVLSSVLLPLMAGVVVHRLAPNFAQRFAQPLSRVATILLVLAAVPLVVVAWPQMQAAIGNGVLIALGLFTVIGIVVGHLLGGPDPDNRTVLALATSARHPAVALAIATASAPQQKGVLAVVLWHLVLGGLIAVPYVLSRTRMRAAKPPAT